MADAVKQLLIALLLTLGGAAFAQPGADQAVAERFAKVMAEVKKNPPKLVAPKGWASLTEQTAPKDLESQVAKTRANLGYFLAPKGHTGGLPGTIQAMPMPMGALPKNTESCERLKLVRGATVQGRHILSPKRGDLCFTTQTVEGSTMVLYSAMRAIGPAAWSVVAVSMGEAPELKKAVGKVLFAIN